MRSFIFVAVLLASVSAFAQAAPTDPVVGPVQPAPAERQQVAFLLSAIHELPPRADFERAAANPWQVVASLAAGRGPIAERAVEAMFYWPTDATFEWARRQLADAKTPRGRLHRVLLHTAEAYGDRATAVVAPFLANPDPQVRITAAAAVAKIRSDEAFAALDAALVAERDEAVATEMRRLGRRILQ